MHLDSYSEDTFGITFTLAKAKPTYWPRLLKSKKHKPRNMHRWWELWEKFEEAIKAIEDQQKNGTIDVSLALSQLVYQEKPFWQEQACDVHNYTQWGKETKEFKRSIRTLGNGMKPQDVNKLFEAAGVPHKEMDLAARYMELLAANGKTWRK